MANAVGIDIGTYSIKIVELRKASTGFEIVRAASVPNSARVVMPSTQRDRDQLIAQLQQVFKEYQFPSGNVHIGLPEAFISTKIISIPVLSDAELASAIPWQAEQYIPIAAEDLQLEYEVLYRPPKSSVTEQMRVLLLGGSKGAITAYANLFAEAGLETTLLETQMLSLYRMAMLDKNQKTTLVVNFGASTMDVMVIHQGEFAFVYSYPNGGNVFSRTLERALGLDPNQAEEYKRAYGLDLSQLEGKVALALEPVFKTFISELQKAVQYFSGSHQGAPVQRMVFSGGSSILPNLIPSVALAFPMEITLLSPLQYVHVDPKVTMSALDAQSFTVAIGLAMAGQS